MTGRAEQVVFSEAGTIPIREEPEALLFIEGKPEPIRLTVTRTTAKPGESLPRPNPVLIGYVRDRDLGLREAIALQWEERDGTCTVRHDDFAQVGEGPNQSFAIDDFQRKVAQRYRALRARQGQLGPEERREWDTLRRWIFERSW